MRVFYNGPSLIDLFNFLFAFSCCSKTCSIAGEKRKKIEHLHLVIEFCFFFFFFMIPKIIFIKMDDTLFNFVVYFSLNNNSVNDWF